MTELKETVAISFVRPADGRLVREHLGSCGYRVVELAESLPQGPDLILLDAPSATRFGISFFQHLKQADPVFLPVIVALDKQGSAANWLNSGVMDDCLRLPLSKAELISRIRVFLRLRQQTAALAEKSEEIRALVESSEDHIFMLSEKGEFISSNDRTSHLMSSCGARLAGCFLEDVYPADIAGTLRRASAVVLEQDQVRTVEYSLPVVRGLLYRHVTLFPVRLAGGKKRIGGICRDVTTLVETEQDRFLLAKVMEFAAESVIITDRDRKIIFVNAGFEKISGYLREDAIGRTPRFLRSGRHDASFYESLHKTIYSGRTWKGDLVNRNRNGSFYVVEATISPVLDEDGEITHFVSVRRDVTEDRQFEKVRQRVQRLEAIGTLAGGIAHDFNNILTPIMGYAELCKISVPPDSQMAQYLDQVLLAAGRSRDLVRQILSFSRKSKQKKVPIDIRFVVKEVLKFIRAVLPADIRIEQRISTGDECVLADPTEIHQVIMNLCTNAQHAMSATGGTLSVSIEPEEVEEGLAVIHPDLRAGSYLVVRVSDTGCGIPEDIQDRIFEPYFTTKEEDRGTGLGLATVHGIVTGLGGAVLLDSEPGKGTVFELYFPVADARSRDEAHNGLTQITGGKERILFIDDEPMIAELGKQILEPLGYTVQSTTDPVAAFKQFRQHPDFFDLVITDMTMPGMSGGQLTAEIHRIRPDIPIIICTGNSDKVSAYRDGKNGVCKLLMKPIGVQELARAVREVLDDGQK
ncbi:hybrid sensor histidine kinase/response regulator [Desulfolithobacter sp.]